MTNVIDVNGDLARHITDVVREAAASGQTSAIQAALASVKPDDLADFFHASLVADPDFEPLAVGLPASPGAASGRIALTSNDALAAGDAGHDVILVRSETTPDDVLGMQASRGILTARGGMVSHAAVVARGWGIPAVVGTAEMIIHGDTVTIGETVLRAGDEITIDGSTGNIYLGALLTTGTDAPPELDTLLAWADAVNSGTVQVRANADTEGDASVGRQLGACGIGLCRTEHMFLAADRLPIMRRFILSDDPETDAAALAELEVTQTIDFETLLEAMDSLPVTVRLLDPPLHEFLPNQIDLAIRDARGELDAEGLAELAAVRRLHEANPMIGTRGVRLGVVRPGLYEMQVRALCQAAANLFDRGKRPHVEIMIPLVVDAEELRIARGWVTGVLDEIGHPELAADVVTIGAMIETPRAALIAGALAEHADFFSFGTNDLTQMTYAFSRDDVESRLLPAYQAQGILPANPFAVLDQDGVGALVRIVALSGCGNTSVEDGKEFVTSYVQTADYIIPSIGTYFNSTCAQCDAGCGIMGRVREGRVLKLEGNPKSPINNGKMCGLGQAGVQAHYNPDRIRDSKLRAREEDETDGSWSTMHEEENQNNKNGSADSNGNEDSGSKGGRPSNPGTTVNPDT